MPDIGPGTRVRSGALDHGRSGRQRLSRPAGCAGPTPTDRGVGALIRCCPQGDDGVMSRRISPRRWRVGSDGGLDPEDVDALEQRREKHERMMQRPARAFGDVLKDRLKADRPETDEQDGDDKEEPGARDPLLGLDPNQNARLANRSSGRRSGRVIVKG